MPTKTLSQVCSILTGFTARGRLEPALHDGVLVLQLRDITQDGSITSEGLTRIQLDDVPDRYLVRTGDVVFRSRGERNTAAVVGEPFTEPALVVLPLMILRPNTQLLSGAYLAWAINQDPAQRHFEVAAQGTGLRMVSRASLAELEIAIPDIDTQRRILQLSDLAEREQELTQQLTLKRHGLIHRLLIERAQGHTSINGNERMPK
jgi:hypothetical protein